MVCRLSSVERAVFGPRLRRQLQITEFSPRMCGPTLAGAPRTGRGFDRSFVKGSQDGLSYHFICC
jgi:hypothetical protein